MRRRLRRILAGTVTLGVPLMVLAGFLVLAPAVLGPPILSDQLRRAGFPEADADVVGYGMSEVVLSVDLDGGGALRPGIVHVAWSPAGLRRWELDRIEIDGLGLRFDVGTVARGDGGEPAIPTLPVGELVVRDVAVELSIAGSERGYLVSGHLDRTADGGAKLHAEARGGGDVLRLDLDGRQGDTGIEHVSGGFVLELTDVAFPGTDARVSAKAEGRMAVAIEPADGHMELVAGGQFRVEASDGLVAEMHAEQVRASLGGGVPHLSSGQLSGTLSGLRIGGLRASIPAMVLALDGTLDAGQVLAEGVVTLDGAPAGGIGVTDATVAMRGRGQWEGSTLVFVPDGCQTVTATRVWIGEDGMGAPLDMCVQATDSGPAVSLDPAGISAALSLRPHTLRVGPRVEASIPELLLAIEAGWDGAVTSFDVESAGMSIVLPEQGTAMEDVSGSVRLHPGDGALLTARLGTAAIRPLDGTALTGPVALELHVSNALGSVAGTAYELAGELSGVLPGRLAGSFDPASGLGALRFDGREMLFGPDGVSLGSVSPWLAQTVQDLEGAAQIHARIGWGPDGLSPGVGELLVRDAAFALGPVTVQGLNTVLRAGSLSPFVLDPGQVVGIGLLDVGVPLTAGQILLGFGAEGYVGIQDAYWSWAGGIVRASPFRIAPGEMVADVFLDAEGLELGRLLQLLPLEGVSGTGVVSGRIPVEIRGDAVTVREGRLAAVHAGTLRYQPDELPAGFNEGGAEMLMQALADFHYDSLVLHLDGTAGGELTARLSVQGANPDFYDGYPVALNLNVSGALDTILRQGIRAYRIPDAVRERMMEFEAHGG